MPSGWSMLKGTPDISSLSSWIGYNHYSSSGIITVLSPDGISNSFMSVNLDEATQTTFTAPAEADYINIYFGGFGTNQSGSGPIAAQPGNTANVVINGAPVVAEEIPWDGQWHMRTFSINLGASNTIVWDATLNSSLDKSIIHIYIPASQISTEDTDGDGINNDIDIDDDNDGVLDSQECSETNSTLFFDEFSGSASNAPNSQVPNGWANINSSDLITINNTIDGGSFVNDSNNSGVIVRSTSYGTSYIEGIYRTVSGFEIGEEYYISLEQSIYHYTWGGCTGQWKVILGGEILRTPTMSLPPWGQNAPFETVAIGPFTATANSMELRIEDESNNDGLQSADLLLDAIHVYKLEVTSCDIDGDGIVNELDLDSDGDGCSDSVESGNTLGSNNDTINYKSGADSNSNGLLDEFEDGTTGTINYVSTYSYAIDNNLNACADTDGDGIGDLIDIDDDNDGVLDTDEDGTPDYLDPDTLPCLTVYNEFTPNGDGANDTFVISCIGEERYKHNRLEIYNRWGVLVYSKNRYDNSWSGESTGRFSIQVKKQLPSGTYYYVLDLGTGASSRIGWLYINRE